MWKNAIFENALNFICKMFCCCCFSDIIQMISLLLALMVVKYVIVTLDVIICHIKPSTLS